MASLGCGGWQSFVSDPEVPAIMQEAGHQGKPQGGGVRRPTRRLGRLFGSARGSADEGPLDPPEAVLPRCSLPSVTACGSDPATRGAHRAMTTWVSACIRRLALRKVACSQALGHSGRFRPPRASRAAPYPVRCFGRGVRVRFRRSVSESGRDGRRPADDATVPVGIHSSPKGMWLF
jgi:hypothetical protein